MNSIEKAISSLAVVAASKRHPQRVSVVMAGGQPCSSASAPLLILALIIKSTNDLFAEASPTGTGDAAITVTAFQEPQELLAEDYEAAPLPFSRLILDLP
jgi:hypothetical protein